MVPARRADSAELLPDSKQIVRFEGQQMDLGFCHGRFQASLLAAGKQVLKAVENFQIQRESGHIHGKDGQMPELS